jgi:hypothetical protein
LPQKKIESNKRRKKERGKNNNRQQIVRPNTGKKITTALSKDNSKEIIKYVHEHQIFLFPVHFFLFVLFSLFTLFLSIYVLLIIRHVSATLLYFVPYSVYISTHLTFGFGYVFVVLYSTLTTPLASSYCDKL